ncbi:hypothetical protein MMC30_007022 [Trapelia coarctata]|nr:hypothetical protein [Trapelia coarctata]
MDNFMDSHSSTVLSQWDIFTRKTLPGAEETAVDGQHLDIATLVAVGRYGAHAYLDDKVHNGIAASAKVLHSQLHSGNVIYGVNTGFGGSADTRTSEVEKLQRTLIRELHAGILPTPPIKGSSAPAQREGSENMSHLLRRNDVLPREDISAATCIPEALVRASMLIRVNSLASGHSAVSSVLVQGMIDLLRKDIVPRIPLRGSISASGDLMPLSYIGGALQGSPGITVWAGSRSAGERRIVAADVALAEASIEPIKLGPKEGLAIINGTAVSTAVAALAAHEANNLAVLSQVVTAISVEALCGTDESFDPFFARVRPHPGQIEAAKNIRSFLTGSKLVHKDQGSEEGSLRQDRYSIRTASQWIGPVLEDFMLAYRQITIECNSVTDNPLINAQSGESLHGGNFQARAITSAMEKTRLGLQTIGQMLYVQCTELINPRTNRGLPPNLVVDEPSQSFLFKPLDIMIAALQSELGFLANPVGSHVQPAEMGNQALNSLALISARYTLVALDVLSQLASAHLFALCQALDLRAMHIRYLETFKPSFQASVRDELAGVIIKEEDLDKVSELLWTQLCKQLEQTTTMDSPQRFDFVIKSLQPDILEVAVPSAESVSALRRWTSRCTSSALKTFNNIRGEYLANPDATPFLGPAARRMYTFVRGQLSVPFLRSDQLDRHQPEQASGINGVKETTPKLTVGSLVTRIYESMKGGGLYVPVMECLREPERDGYSTK